MLLILSCAAGTSIVVLSESVATWLGWVRVYSYRVRVRVRVRVYA